jgi:1-acyl-sn-glycerol-3-phosphate acyltransferase
MLDRLGWCWRLVATGLCFVTFGVGGLLMWALVFPALFLFVRGPSRRALLARLIIHRTFRFFVNLMRRLGVLTYEAHGLERLNRPGLLILANHPSLIDVVFLISFTPRADCVIKAALLRNPFARGAVLAAGFISNSEGPPMLNDCIASVQSGSHLIIFPEGTRSVPSEPLKLQRGAANVAVRGRIPITPVVITCNPATLTKGEPWWRVPARRPHFRLEVREDLPTEQIIAGQGSDVLAARRLTAYLTDYFTSETRRDR